MFSPLPASAARDIDREIYGEDMHDLLGIPKASIARKELLIGGEIGVLLKRLEPGKK